MTPRWKPESERYAQYDDALFSKVLFVGFFIFGAVSIVIGKSFGSSWWVVTGIPVGCLLLHAYIGWRLNGFHESVGDSSYYLGFLYTLVSISMALYQFNADLDASYAGAFVRNFGIALATTITGLLLRVLFGQYAHEPAEVEHDARASLAQVASTLRHEIGRATEDVRGFGEKILATQEKALGDSIARTASMLDGLGNTFQQTLTDSLHGIGDPVKEIGKIAKRLNGSMETVVTASDRIAKRINSIDVPPDLLSRKIDAVLTALNDAVSQHESKLRESTMAWEAFGSALRSSAETLRAVDSTGKSFSGSMVSSMTALEGIATSTVALNQLAETLATLGKPMQQVGEYAQAFSAAVGAAVVDVMEHIEVMKSHRGMLAAELAVVTEQTKTLRSAAAELASSVIEHGQHLKSAAEAQGDAVKELAKLGSILRDVEPALGRVVVTATAMGEAVTPVEAATRNFRELATSLEATSLQFSSAGASASQHQAALAQLTAILDDDGKRVKQHREALEAEVTQARDQLKQFHQSLLGLANVITSELNGQKS